MIRNPDGFEGTNGSELTRSDCILLGGGGRRWDRERRLFKCYVLNRKRQLEKGKVYLFLPACIVHNVSFSLCGLQCENRLRLIYCRLLLCIILSLIFLMMRGFHCLFALFFCSMDCGLLVLVSWVCDDYLEVSQGKNSKIRDIMGCGHSIFY